MPGNKIPLFIDKFASFNAGCRKTGLQILFQKTTVIHRAKADPDTVFFSGGFFKPSRSSKSTCLRFRHFPHWQQHPPKNILFQPP